MPVREPWLDEMAASRHQLDRSSTAAWLADLIRARIADGHLRPGTRLSDNKIAPVMEVSRNVVREAFQILIKDRLLVQKLNRGVFVNRVPADGLADLYRIRRILECEAVRGAAQAADPAALDRVEAAVAKGERAAEAGKWDDVGTADIMFHKALAALMGSPRVDEMIGHLLVEMRLVFHEMGSPREFHEPYLTRNRRIHTLLARGEVAAAEAELRSYLDDAEAQLTNAYREQESAARSS
ncbi:GntR family transcriptional regulator [Actinomadura meridiana]|uniref:GntR family transcriptional regulator n=1 Tax=Actinomadura meridiana TaxID=559626 RepID=A0ABP8CCI8_9ACTN